MAKTENRKIYISINGKDVEHSYKGIRKEVMSLSRELDKLAPGTEEFERKSRQLDNAKKRFDDVAKATGRTNRGLQQSNNLLNGLKGAVIGAFGVGAVVEFGRKIISVRSEMEKYEAVLTNTFLGDNAKARRSMQMIQQLAAETPFSVRQLTDSYVKLVNRGIVPTQQEMTKLGDLSASVGKDYDQLVEAMLDAQTGEFERLKEFGIRASKNGEQVAFTFKGVTETVAMTDQAIKDYIMSLGDLEGVSGSMSAISETLGGRISNLGDSWDMLLNNLGKGTPLMKNMVGLLGQITGAVADWVAIPMSENLEEERIAMNANFEVLKDGNITNAQRRDLIREINEKYGDQIETQLTVKTGVEELTKAQNKLNQSLQEQILIQSTKEVRGELEERATSIQTGLLKQRRILEEQRQKGNTDAVIAISKMIKEGEANLKEAQRDLEKFQIENAKLLAGRSADQWKKAMEEGREAAMGGYDKWLEEQRKANQQEGEGSNPKKNPLAEAYGEEETKRVVELMQNSFNQIAEQEKLLLMEKREAGKISKEDYEHELKALEIARLEAVKAAREQIGLDTLDVEQRLLEEKIALMDKEAKADDKLTRNKEKNSDKMIEAEQARQAAAIESAYRSGMAAAEQAESFDEAARAVLNSIRQQIKAHIAEATAVAVADALKSIPFPFNIALAAGAGAAVSGLFDTIIPKFAAGGYTGMGTGRRDETGFRPAGVVHEGEYVVPQWMVQSPKYASTISNLEAARMSGAGRYAAGGTVSNVTTNNNTQTINIDRLESAVGMLTAQLASMQRNGIKAVADDRFARDLQEVDTRYNQFIKDKSEL